MLLAPPTEPHLSYDWSFPFVNLCSAEIKSPSFHATQDFLNSNSNFRRRTSDQLTPPPRRLTVETRTRTTKLTRKNRH